MKKIILIIFIILLIFQMVVLAVAIDVGNTAIDRTTFVYGNMTFVDKHNPANDTGTITSVEIWANTEMANVEVAIFYVVSGNYLSTRDDQVIGTVTAGSKQSFDVDLDVEVGDYIGIYFTSGAMEIDDTGGTGWWYSMTDSIPCTNTLFVYQANRTASLYGTGTTEEEEENAIFFGINF